MRFTRHAKNECRLYNVDQADAEAVVAEHERLLIDDTGKSIYEAIIRGRVLRIVIALDEPDLIVTIYPRRR